MRSSPRFFGLDTVMVDVVLKIEALPLRGLDSLASERLVTAGGGFNAMSAAARQGMSVSYAGQLGTGVFADIARSALAHESIEVAVHTREAQDLGFCVVLVDREGERTFVTSPGAEGTLRADDLVSIAMEDGDYASLSGYNFVYDDIRDETMKWLEQLSDGVIVCFDPGPRVLDIPDTTLRKVLERTDWLLCNLSEASSLTGESSAATCVQRLLVMGGRRGVVVRTGAEGCVGARRGESPVRVAGIKVPVLDTNGAGDVHNGVFLAECARGTSFVEALQRANVAAAVAIGHFGPATCPARAVVTREMNRSNSRVD
ncbi:MAG: PfkB family carbohydrate kinase [Acidimicrobiales bacterium]